MNVCIICIHMITLGSPCKRHEVLVRVGMTWIAKQEVLPRVGMTWIGKQEVMARVGRTRIVMHGRLPRGKSALDRELANILVGLGVWLDIDSDRAGYALSNLTSFVYIQTQMAFVKNCQILDIFVVANEIIHSWKSDVEGGLVIKLDFEKAYDSVDHGFLDSIMKDMGFGENWRLWIQSCITSPELSVLVNGSPTLQFGIKRGLRQGDPLSPFLFNIVTEALSCLFQKAHGLGMMEGAVFGNDSVHVSHLQFADDTIIFLRPKMEYLCNVRRILRCYELASGLKINFHKSCVIRVGRNIPDSDAWVEAFNCQKAVLPINYLRLPFGNKKTSKATWDTILNRIRNRLAPWKRNFVNKGGRLVLIKSVLSSLPSYFMSVFRMPVGVAMDIEKVQRSFFWGDGREKRKLHAVNWETLCNSKKNGGLGIVRSKPQSHFIQAIGSLFVAGTNTAKIFKEGIQVKVGNGNKASFWHDPCGLDIPLKEGIYSVSSFRRCLEDCSAESNPDHLFIWQGVCPPKVEMFIWQLLKGKVLVSEVLKRFGYVAGITLDCPLCNSGEESIDHLFLHCSWTRELWIRCMKWWDVKFCASKTLLDWARGWPSLCPNSSCCRVWNSMFFALAWTV
ncbi:hypothetical protein Q3G72_011280 [Acer saccharum]|nr:hypothetical protein Q3G72_011280 [Acer saccharum]